MGSVFSFEWEERFIIFLQNFMSPAMVKIAGIFTEFGDAMILTGIIGLFYCSLNKELGKKLVVYLSLVNNIYPCFKAVIKRKRPYMLNEAIKPLKPVTTEGDVNDIVAQGYSFPSGHACNCTSIYGVIIKNSKKFFIKLLLFILILIVGLSRVALGVHYPTDIIFGWIIGGIFVSLFSFATDKLGRNRTYLLAIILCSFGFLIADSNDFYSGYGMLVGSICGILFEEKYVNFEVCRKPLAVLLRSAGGVVIYLGLNTLLKMPFSKEFLNSGTMAAFSVRAIRYAITVFVLIGIYPISFKLFKRKEK